MTDRGLLEQLLKSSTSDLYMYFNSCSSVHDCFSWCRLSFDLLGEDSLLLERLVQTLGIVLYCAGNAPQFLSMSRAFWDFAFAIRLHVGSAVKKQLLFGLLMIVSFGGKSKLREEFYQDMVETHAWLLGIFHDDPDPECRSMAAQITNAIVDIFKEGNAGLFDLTDHS
jgi:hypothetical protein